jgi:NADH dehydrogenase
MHVVIVGGGFGGVKAALELSKKQIGKITLISNKPYFLHYGTLYATATGKNFAESVIPLRTVFAHHPNVEIIEDTITGFDPQRRLISSNKKDYHYDKLILALGSVTTYFGIPGVQQHSYGIKSLDDIKKFQDHIHSEVVQQKLDKEYFVIGAGQTGVELAAALNVYLKTLIHLHRLKNTSSKVTMVEASPKILPQLSTTASTKVAQQLKKQHIRIYTNHKVEALSDDSIVIDGKKHATTTALWTSGVANNPFYKDHEDHFQLTPNGRVAVNPYLEALHNVYVIGDNNNVKHSHMALPAMQQAKHVAKNITRLATKRAQKAYRSRSVPVGVPVGDAWGYVEWYGIYAAGHTGAFIRRFMELYGYCQLLPFKNALPIWRAHALHHIDGDF